MKARWGVNSELRTPFTPPHKRCYFGGREYMQCRGSGGAASFPRGQPAARSFSLSQPSFLASVLPSVPLSRLSLFIPDLRRGEMGQEVWSRPLTASLEGACGFCQRETPLLSSVEHAEGTEEQRQSQAHQAEGLVILMSSKGTLEPSSLSASNRGLG